MKPSSLRAALAGIALFALFQAVLLYLHLSDVGHVVATLVGVFAGWRIGAARSAMLLVSLSLVVVFIELAYGLTKGEQPVGGHGYLTAGRRYLPDREVEFQMGAGNLVAIGGPEYERIAVPRPARWVTDARGYRNSQEIAEPRLVVVGDSFIAGVGTSQEDTLSEQLTRDFQIDTLSLGHPGNFRRYSQTLEANEDLFEAPRDPLLFVYAFEGNDFLDDDPRLEKFLTHRTKRRSGITSFYRSSLDSFGWINELWAKVFAPEPAGRVRTALVGGTELGFFREYDAIAERGAYDVPRKVGRALHGLLERADVIFFIPTKSRVYEPWISPDDPLPNAQWNTLAAAAADADGAVVVDLTGPLRERAAELLPSGEFVFWPDDTHWNGAGIRVAAEQAARWVSELEAVSEAQGASEREARANGR